MFKSLGVPTDELSWKGKRPVEHDNATSASSPENATLALLREAARGCDARDHANVASWVRAVHIAMKRVAKPWSYVLFSEMAGLGQGNWLAQVVARKRRLTEASLHRLALTLDLPTTQTAALKALARHGLARDPLRRQELWKDVERSQERRNTQLERDDMFRFLGEWQHVVVLETLALFPEGARISDLAATIRYVVGNDAFGRSLSMLSDMGLARADKDGLWIRTSLDVDLGGSIPGSGVLRFHHRMIDLAKDALTHLPENEREVGAITVACPQAFLPKLKRMLEEFQTYVLWMAHEQGDADAVYQLNLQLFPLTRKRSGT